MTKLYCPKGHETTQWDNYTMNKNSIFGIYSCSKCLRPYWEIDCLTEPKKENQENPRALNLNEINNIELKISADPRALELKSHVNDINAVETKVNPSDMEWVNPKRESQVAIERVIEALDRSLQEVLESNEIKLHEAMYEAKNSKIRQLISPFIILKSKLEEINK